LSPAADRLVTQKENQSKRPPKTPRPEKKNLWLEKGAAVAALGRLSGIGEVSREGGKPFGDEPRQRFFSAS